MCTHFFFDRFTRVVQFQHVSAVLVALHVLCCEIRWNLRTQIIRDPAPVIMEGLADIVYQCWVPGPPPLTSMLNLKLSGQAEWTAGTYFHFGRHN